jgi:ABC-type phosphate transport system substrate-binding protein
LLKTKKIVATAAILGAGFAAFSTSSAVQAEPVSNSYAIVGSDTLEDVVNAIVNGTAITGSTVRVTINGATLGSFDATGAPYVITKPGGVRFSRPNGSGEGFQALSASIGTSAAADAFGNLFTSGTYQNKGESSVSGSGGASMPASLKNINVNGQIDISRSSSSDPKSTKLTAADATATIVRVPFARDAITIVMHPTLADAVCAAESQGTIALGTCVPYLSAAQLMSLYETTSASPTLTINGTSIAFNPVIPQAGSGTRKDFLGKILTGTKDSNNQTTAFLAAETAGYVRTGQEHDAISAAFIAAGTSAIEPMSASRWIAMKNGASYDKSGAAVIGSIYTATTLGASPVTGTAPALAPSTSYYADSTWGRDVYLFVERARIDSAFTAGGTITAGSKYDANLFALLDPTLNNLSNSQTTGASKVGKVKLAYGFLAPSVTDLAYFAPSYASKY